MKTIGNLIKVRGFSSFKFLPGSEDTIIVALKTEEHEGETATYIMAFNIDGSILMPELKVIDKKFEGLEFVWRLIASIYIFVHNYILIWFYLNCSIY